jgi:hypothetical protein
MSETLVTFAEPLLADVPRTEAGWRPGLSTAVVVWNGIVSGMAEAEIVTQLQRLGLSADGPGVVRRLTERKRSLFANDARFIFDVRTHQNGERVDVSAVSGLSY